MDKKLTYCELCQQRKPCGLVTCSTKHLHREKRTGHKGSAKLSVCRDCAHKWAVVKAVGAQVFQTQIS